MSLFDVLKYPLSDPPTKEEILAIPKDIIDIVYDRVGLSTYGSHTDTLVKRHSLWFCMLTYKELDDFTTTDMRQILIDVLRDYNEPV